MNLHTVVKAPDLGDFTHTKRGLFTKEIAYRHGHFENLEDYNKPLTESKSEDYFSKTTGKISIDEENARTTKVIQELILKNGKEPTMVYCN